MDFYEKYFELNLNDFPNIGIDFEINKLLFVFLLGTLFAIIAINYIRSNMYTVIKALTRHGADSEENAKTLAELGIDKKSIRALIGSNTQLKRTVGVAGQMQYTYEEYIKLLKDKNFSDKINFDEAKLYIKSEERELAKNIFDAKSPTALETVLMCLLMTAIFVCLMFFMPSILTLINNMIK